MPKGQLHKVGILYNESRYSPSNLKAIEKFKSSALRFDLDPIILTENDFVTYPSYQGLLIRDTTHPGNYTFQYAVSARFQGIKVVDSPDAIQKGCNKIWQVMKFQENNIKHPKSFFVNYNNSFIDEIPFPCVVKIPDSCFSRGVFKCNNKTEYADLLYELWFKKGQQNKLLVCQEFIETKFDWRITVFNGQFLFALKYYMVQDHWKIIKYDRVGRYIDGKHECVAFDKVPLHVLASASKVIDILGDGLYGIDIKEYGNDSFVIEANDNPSIDAGVEDELEGDKIYDTIMRWFSPHHVD